MSSVQLSEYSMSEKLALLESLWADLAGDEETLDSPLWHESILREREESFRNGKTIASDWEEVKKRLRKKLT